MPATFKRKFRVRQYECDAYGHVNHANYLRYMQEAAIDASAAVGYDEARYNAIGHFWLIRETEIEYLRQLVYGDAVEITTWVGDFRRVRSRRFYEFQHLDSGEMVARASTDWVYLERETLRPTSVPPEMIAAFAPEGDLPPQHIRERFPPAPPPPPGVYTMSRMVEWRDVDAAGHVNNATYLNYMEECAIRAAASVGWTVDRMRREGFAPVSRRHRIEYRQQAALGEEITVSTYLSDVRRSSAVRHFIIARANDGAVIAQARTLWVFVNWRTGSILRLNPDYVADFADSIASE